MLVLNVGFGLSNFENDCEVSNVRSVGGCQVFGRLIGRWCVKYEVCQMFATSRGLASRGRVSCVVMSCSVLLVVRLLRFAA